jgi:hypothetical protein
VRETFLLGPLERANINHWTKKKSIVSLKAYDTSSLGQEKRADGGIHAVKNNSNIRSVLKDTKHTA